MTQIKNTESTKMRIRRDRKNSVIIPAALGATLLALAGCSTEPNYVACPQITSPQEGTFAFVNTDTLADEVDVRFNGVNPVCYALENGDVRVDINVGLKMQRTSVDGDADIITLPLLVAVVDSDDNVVRNERVVYKAGFQKDNMLKYPVAELSFDVASGNRIVLSLSPSL